MSTATRVIKNTGYLYAKMGVTMFISLYTTRLILNSLGASDFGIFNIVGGAISMLGFLNAAMASATQRFMSYSEGEGDKEKQKSIFNVSFVLHFGIAFAVGVALVIAGCFFFNGILNIPAERMFAAQVVYGSLIVSTMFTVMTVPYDAAMNAHENMKYYAIVGILESLLKLAVAFACVYTAHDKLIVYGSLMACIPLVTLTIMRVYCHRHYEECTIRIRKYWDKGLMKEMTSFAGWNFASSVISIISSYGIGIVLNIFYGTIANAAQGVANQISGQLGALGTSLRKAVGPIITKSAGANDKAMMIQSSITGTKLTFFIVTVFFIPILTDANYILHLWLGTPPKEAIMFCTLLLIANIFQNATLFIPQAIAAVGYIKNYTLWSSAVNASPILLTYIAFSCGCPPYFMYITMIIASIGKTIVDLYYGQQLCDINGWKYIKNVISRLFSCVVLAFMTGFILVQFIHPCFIRFCLVAFFSISTYGIALFFIGFDKKEKQITRLVILSFKKKMKITKA